MGGFVFSVYTLMRKRGVVSDYVEEAGRGRLVKCSTSSVVICSREKLWGGEVGMICLVSIPSSWSGIL